jgi:hypothetical protein
MFDLDHEQGALQCGDSSFANQAATFDRYSFGGGTTQSYFTRNTTRATMPAAAPNEKWITRTAGFSGIIS